MIPRTQASSHGAGHSRPVNSGKLLVACSRSRPPASGRDRPGRSSRESCCPAGSPWQKGTPQSMHRAAWPDQLLPERGGRFPGIPDPLLHRTLSRRLAVKLLESGRLSHVISVGPRVGCGVSRWSPSSRLDPVMLSRTGLCGFVAGQFPQGALVVRDHLHETLDSSQSARILAATVLSV